MVLMANNLFENVQELKQIATICLSVLAESELLRGKAENMEIHMLGVLICKHKNPKKLTN